jgi:micrococcal nuclease
MAPSRAVLAVAATAVLVGSLWAAVSGSPPAWWPLGSGAATYDATILEVVDGDTVVARFDDGRRETVRLLGADTPETVHPTRPVECFGPEASEFTKRELRGRRVRLETDVEPRDRYGRLLAHVRVDGSIFETRLLREGYARLLVIPPNVRHGRELLRAQLDARAEGRGLWSACV